MEKRVAFLIVFMCCACGFSFAQPKMSFMLKDDGNFVSVPVERVAETKASYYRNELGLTEKQYNKIYALYLTQAENHYPVIQEVQMQFTYTTRADASDFEKERAMKAAQEKAIKELSRNAVKPNFIEPDKSIAKRDKKMQKILSDEQYQRWKVMEEEDIRSWREQVEAARQIKESN